MDILDHLAEAMTTRPATINCARAPDTFSGEDPKKLDNFLLQCRLFFHADPVCFCSDATKVTFAMTYLTGTALRWFEQAVELEDTDNEIASYTIVWSEFVDELRTHFR